MNLLNSPFTQWVLKFGLSKGGIAVRWLVALLIGALAKAHIFPEGDLKEIELGITSGLTAALALLYGWIEWWIQHRQKDGVRALQAVAQLAAGPQNPKMDGIAGNETIKALARAAGVASGAAVAAVHAPADV